MRAALLCLLLLLVLPPAARAQGGQDPLTIDLAQKSVNITAGFTGASLALFGTKKQPGDIAVVIKGPERRMVVRRKDQVGGIWMNRESVRFRNVPVYYDIALSKPARDLADPAILQDHEIGLDALNFEPVGQEDPENVRLFREALIRNEQLKGYFSLEPKDVIFLNDNFFRANFYMPANVPTGDYSIKTYLFQNGELKAEDETRLRVAQVGFNASLYRFANTNAVTYGLVAVLLAMLAGGAGWMFLRKD